MGEPLVSVICLCYNQERFVRETIGSVLNQSYKNTELIIVDDASADSSVKIISEAIQGHPEIQFMAFDKNVGNCKAFNRGLSLAKGEYLIDLAADDVLLPDRIAKGVQALKQAGPSYGVNFSDAEWISESGAHLHKHSERFPHTTIPQGNIYKDLIERFFICSPTVMFTREVIDYLGGYDETLSYEDFDFWIRSSRKFLYCYSPEALVKKRIVKKSLSEKQFRFFSPHSHTTFKVCEKIFLLSESVEEQRALGKRLRYEFLLNLRLLNFPVAFQFLKLILRNKKIK
jgi:glycosyltransferase involved in cell wall biosynthesis